MSFDDLADGMRRARVVVSHAGVGSIMLARRCGKVPIVVPRLRRLEEAVDDHQVQLARRLAGLGVVVLVEDDALLGDAIHGGGAAAPVGPQALEPAATLVDEIGSFLAGCRVASAELNAAGPLRSPQPDPDAQRRVTS
jgi:predicted glycosyltransferase